MNKHLIPINFFILSVLIGVIAGFIIAQIFYLIIKIWKDKQ